MCGGERMSENKTIMSLSGCSLSDLLRFFSDIFLQEETKCPIADEVVSDRIRSCPGGQSPVK
jgi:hypothetical protein